MKKIINQSIEYVLSSFGFDNVNDSLQSMFGGITKGSSLVLCSIFGTIATMLHDWVGLEAKVYAALVCLFLLEFGTGVAASLVIRKERFNSNKLGRIIIKIVVYTGLLILFNAFKDQLGIDVFNLSFNFFEWIYYIVLNLLILQLVVSVFENLEALGWKEVGIFVRIFKKKINKIEDNDTASKQEDGVGKENKV